MTDFVSFYTLPSTVMHHPTHKTLKAAYSFYNISVRTNPIDLMQDALIVAKNVSLQDAVRGIQLTLAIISYPWNMTKQDFLSKLMLSTGIIHMGKYANFKFIPGWLVKSPGIHIA